MSKEQQIRAYLEEHVDPFLKPMLMDIMKQQPANVYEYMCSWVEGRGKEINAELKNNMRDMSKSVHYDNVKKSVIEQKPEEQVEQTEQKEETQANGQETQDNQEEKKEDNQEPQENAEEKKEENTEAKPEEEQTENKEEEKKEEEPKAE